MAKAKRFAPAAGRCACCNRACRAGFGFCAECNYAATSTEWPIALGHAIARFVRRAEVAGLVEEVESHLEDAIGSAESRLPATLDRAVDDLRTALDRLARLAGGGA